MLKAGEALNELIPGPDQVGTGHYRSCGLFTCPGRSGRGGIVREWASQNGSSEGDVNNPLFSDRDPLYLIERNFIMPAVIEGV